MDYQNLPFSCDTTKDISQFTPEDTPPRSQMHRLQILCIQECFRTGSDSVMPDSKGCDTVFLESFMTPGMIRDFPVIFQDFLLHEYSSLSRYAHSSTLLRCSQRLPPKEQLQQKLFALMYAAFKQESPYSVHLFRRLYKTYYNQEYQQLKRFHTLTYQDIFSLANNPREEDFISATARILTASTLFPIEPNPNCAAIHFALNRHTEKLDSQRQEKQFVCPDSLARQCRETISQMMEPVQSPDALQSPVLKTYRLLADRSAQFLHAFGYPKNYISFDTDSLDSMHDIFSRTLSVMKRKSLRTDFTFDEIQTCAALYACIRGFCAQHDALNSFVDSLLAPERFADMSACRFSPEKPQPPLLAEQENTSTPEPVPTSASARLPDENKDKLTLEIASLRARLLQQEQENQHLHSLYSESRSALASANVSLRQYENDRKELIALRNHVYLFTEDDTALPPEDINAMCRLISQKRIIIIGGHSNWTYKLRNRFPAWSFLSPKTSGSVDNRLLKRADYVYFFTNIIKHCTYMRFIRIVREQDIPFGYIHSINIQSNIQQIYRDISAAGR